ncbi:Multidrug resistance protein MdtK [Planctomycetes bacterium Poly30]|uniref:Multidrug-efflux transporter n=2 Tax=Saltatorellus ferox TaxID=2528018 RepID=A0A518EKP8_9BACT|nr:Multidrug resistance protein MdtK [Planctomycetes bacterium Poly30]
MGSAILVLALPVMIQQLLQAFVGMTDKLFAGHLDEEVRVAALDAIGIGSYMGWFIGIAMSGLGIGGQAIIARAMGAGRNDEARHALGQAMGVSLVWGLGVGLILWGAAPWLAEWTGLTPVAGVLLSDYLRVLALSMPVAAVMLVGAMCLHGAGETRKPATIAVLVNLVNAVMSWALSGADIDLGSLPGNFAPEGTLLVNPFSFDMGVAGIAAGTSIGYAVGAIWTWKALMKGVPDLALERSELRPRRVMIVRFLRVGVPNFAEGIAMWAVNLIVLLFIGRIAVDGGLQGAHIIAIQWESFSFLPGFAIGTAAATLTGQYLGAGDPASARRAVLTCAAFAAALMGTLGVVFMTMGETLTRIISNEPIHLELVPKLLFICGAVQVFFAFTIVVRQSLRGAGDTRWVFLITAFSSYAVRLPATYVFGVVMGLGLEGIWYGLCGEFLIRALLFGSRFFHGGWQKIRV